jgi:hypothetical protein
MAAEAANTLIFKLEPNEQSRHRVRSQGIPIPPIHSFWKRKKGRTYPPESQGSKATQIHRSDFDAHRNPKKTLIAPPFQNKIKAGQYEGIH